MRSAERKKQRDLNESCMAQGQIFLSDFFAVNITNATCARASSCSSETKDIDLMLLKVN